MDVQLSVEFGTVKQRRTPFTEKMPGDGWFRAFLCRHSEFSPFTSENANSSSATQGEEDITKWQTSYLFFGYFR
jgi:hypothetical protein